MPTNDVFHNIIILLQLHKEKDLIIDIFESAGVDISKSKIKAWSTKTGDKKDGYREMPREALDAFLDELHKRKLVEL